ncbi:MAG TPA: hypothetical protein VFX60_19940 [Micromonospora sp.]|nr:hypothetical protein [Micromonospora sp.]
MRRLALIVTLPLLVTGCALNDIRRPVPTPPAPSAPPPISAPAPAVPVTADEVRRGQLPVPDDFDLGSVEFTDAEHGYGLFTRCGSRPRSKPSCTVRVLSTTDGGRSWQQLRHPPLAANNPQLSAAGDHLLLFSEPHHWYISADRGRSFRHERSPEPPGAYWRLFGRFHVDEESGQVAEWVNGRAKPVPVQPSLPEVARTVYANGRLIVVGLQDDRPYVVISLDKGKTWQQTIVARDSKVVFLRTLSSSDGRDVFLMGSDDRISFPLLWRLDGHRWEPVEAAGHPERVEELAAIGDGMLAVTGPSGSGVIADGRYQDLGWPLGGNEVRVLDDGTLFSVHPDRSIWLGIGHATDRRWVKILTLNT